MKTTTLLAVAIGATLGFTACEKKDPTLREEVKDSVDDALDRRPGEEVRDAAEDIEKDAEKAAKDIGDAIKDVGEAIKEDVKEATE